MNKWFLIFITTFFCNIIHAQKKPCNNICEVPRLVQYGAYIGVQINNSADRNHVVIKSIVPNTSAEKINLQPGDIIEVFDKKTIYTVEQLIYFVSLHQPGDKVQITYNRKGIATTKVITLSAMYTRKIMVKECCDKPEKVENIKENIKQEKLEFKIKFNPDNKFILEINTNINIAGDVVIKIYNESNHVVKTIHTTSDGKYTTSIDLSDMQSGKYIINIITAKGTYKENIYLGKKETN